MDYLQRMYEEQVKLNNNLFPNWKEELTQEDWYAEVIGELVEAMESTNHKWWADGKTDEINLLIEVVDVWHFYLSSLAYFTSISRRFILNGVKEEFEKPTMSNLPSKECLGKEVRRLVVDIVMNNKSLVRQIDFVPLVQLSKLAGMSSLNDLYCFYLIKKTLNQFRKDNGYKEGKYIKIWNGIEDNHFIFRYWLENKNDLLLDVGEEVFIKHIYSVLEREYNTKVKK